MKKMIYLDHAATTPVDPRVVEVMMPYFSQRFGNPSSLYEMGVKNRKALDSARKKMAELLGAENPSEIIFTSGGSESNNFFIKGLALQKKDQGNHIITSRVEHSAVIKTCQAMEKLGFSVTYLPVDNFGMVDPEELKKAITPRTILISIMTANNEVGTIEPVFELAEIARYYNIPFHTDAVQAVGSLKIDVRELGIDSLSLSAHKFYGPKGVGALYLKEKVKLFPLIHGGGQENKMRGGTENVAGILGMVKALELAVEEREERNKKIKALRDKLISGIKSRIPRAHLTGHPEKRLPGNASFIFQDAEGEELLRFLAKQGVSVSTGAACSSRSSEVSHVLRAMGYSLEMAQGSIRFTIGKDNTGEEIDHLLSILPGLVQKIREGMKEKSPLLSLFSSGGD